MKVSRTRTGVLSATSAAPGVVLIVYVVMVMTKFVPAPVSPAPRFVGCPMNARTGVVPLMSSTCLLYTSRCV